jgi:glutathione S-transferase
MIKGTLYSIPVSNYSAMIRDVIYRYDLPIDIKHPGDLGGLKSPEYLSKFPSGKMPALEVVDSDLKLYESSVILDYLLPSFEDERPERYYNLLAARVHDIYHGAHQSVLYKPVNEEQRNAGLEAFRFTISELDRILGLIDGQYFGGEEVARGDLVYPTFAFYLHILPNYYDFNVFADCDTLAGWWAAIKDDSICQKVLGEMKAGLQEWEDAEVFAKLYGKRSVVDFI